MQDSPLDRRRAASLPWLGKTWVVAAGILGVLVIGMVDATLLPPGLGVAPFYAVLVFWVANQGSRGWGLAVAVLGALTWMQAERMAGFSYSKPWLLYWNAFIRLCFFLLVAAYAGSRKSLEAERRRSATDTLTGLLNRRGFQERGGLELRLCRRYGHALTALFADCDDFKAVNDTLGHEAGNRLLQEVGRVIARESRSFDVSARLGGDEFAMLLPETGERQAHVLVERLRERLREAMQGGGWAVTFSLGVATFPTPPGSLGEALKEADRLMYRAKNRGKDATEYAVMDVLQHIEETP